MGDEKDLGMHRRISRRDFLNGVALTIGGTLLPRAALAVEQSEYVPEKAVGYYPPARTGMRGNHDGTFTYAHRLRDGELWNDSTKPETTGEVYDLVIVGAGISGLAAAYFYRKIAGKTARLLIPSRRTIPVIQALALPSLRSTCRTGRSKPGGVRAGYNRPS